MIEIQLQTIICPTCNGNGWILFSGMGADNMDVWSEIENCDWCVDGIEHAEYVEVVVG